MTTADLSTEDRIWLAGLLEGEGTFDLQRGKYARIRVGMTDRDVVGRVASLFGSSIRLTLKGKPVSSIWHAEIQGPRAEAIMRAVLPYMGARRSSKIAEILATRTFRFSGDGGSIASGIALTRPPGIARQATA